MSFDKLRMSGIFKIPARGEPVEPFERTVRKKNMICGIGTDIVAIKRFQPWCQYPQERLLKIFYPQELTELTPQKLAARFAAKEAFFKALSATLERLNLTQKEFSLTFICKTVYVTASPWETPALAVDWESINKKIEHQLPSLTTHLSLSHDSGMAVAFVVIERT